MTPYRCKSCKRMFYLPPLPGESGEALVARAKETDIIDCIYCSGIAAPDRYYYCSAGNHYIVRSGKDENAVCLDPDCTARGRKIELLTEIPAGLFVIRWRCRDCNWVEPGIARIDDVRVCRMCGGQMITCRAEKKLS